jgi:hypothetical protein
MILTSQSWEFLGRKTGPTNASPIDAEGVLCVANMDALVKGFLENPAARGPTRLSTAH